MASRRVIVYPESMRTDSLVTDVTHPRDRLPALLELRRRAGLLVAGDAPLSAISGGDG
jgi:hypothetical protein